MKPINHYRLTKSGKPPKYRAVKVTTDDGTFDSKKEARRWGELQLLEKAGEITDLSRQVPFKLDAYGSTIGKIILDFTYCENDGTVIYEDVKSPATMTPIFRWKQKHFEAQYKCRIKLVM